MSKIKNIVSKHLYIIGFIMALFIVLMAAGVQIFREQQNNRFETEKIFTQVQHLLDENSKELEMIRTEYSEQCLDNAETIAYIIQNNPKVLNSIDTLKYIADITNVDEIHLFNEEGVIFNGTHPQYYDMSVNDGEQIGFFKKMLQDKSLKLVQPLSPNTAEKKYIQYSAVWSPNGKFFVQVGMEQQNVQKVTEKNELPYIFSLLRANSNINLYAVDKKSGKILGSTQEGRTGKNLSEIGISHKNALSNSDGFYAVVDGQLCFCMFADCGDNFIGRVVTARDLYSNVQMIVIISAIGSIIIILIMLTVIKHFINKEVITEISTINNKLAEISEGNLDEKVDVSNCLEFSKLSEHINEMISALLASTEKISYVLDKVDVQIGVYEYNEKMKSVRFTEKVPKILSLDDEQMQVFSYDYVRFKQYIQSHIFDVVSPDENIFRLYGETEKYIKYEEINSNNDILGIVMDITTEYVRRRQLEINCEVDPLTGLLNRRGLASRFESLFNCPDKLGHGALVMLDADGLKKINDELGHEAGDAYLKSISEILISFNSPNCISARYGGDEFILFIHNLENDSQVDAYLQKLADIRRETKAEVAPDEIVPIRFSFGASFLSDTLEPAALFKNADEEMYSNKRRRKQQM